MIGALHTLLMVCSFGDRPGMWAPFDAAMTRLGQHLPDDLRLLAGTYADPVRTAAGVIGQLDLAISALPAESDQVRILTVSTAAFFTDRLAGCRDSLWRVVREGREGGVAARTITALTLLGTDGFMSGDWGAAQQAADECLQACQTHGCPVRAWMPRTLRALLAAARGDYDIAWELSGQIVKWALPLGIRQAQTAVHQVGALAALGRGDYEEAYQEAAAISPPGVFASHVPYALRVAMDLVEAAVRTRRSDEARAHVAAMRTARIARISPRLDMLATASAAIAAPADETGPLFSAALAVPGADRWPFDFARVQLAYGEHLRRDRMTTQARAQLGAALAAFRVLGARAWAERADNELRAGGLHVVRAGGHTLPSLTAQERQIASLAAGGLTNKEIGQRLRLSHRTVGGHLYQIFPKLGVTTRAALRDAVTALSPG
jgi:DNA-binding CsgD family transcriptional regulator